MTIDKKISYEVQGGVKNYLGKQKEVTAPVKWKSSPDSPETELAYITKAEKNLLVKKDLHGSLKGGVNKGPSGIMSLDGFGSFDDPSDPGRDTGMSGAATSDAEAGRTTANTRAEGPGRNLPPGVRDKGLEGYRDAFIAAGGGQRVNPGFFDSRNVVSPAEIARARAFNPAAFRAGRRGSGILGFLGGGGIIGNLVRGLGQRLGFGKRFNEPTYDMSQFNNLGLFGQVPEDFEDDPKISLTSFTTPKDIIDNVVIDNDMSLVPDRPMIGTDRTVLSDYDNYLMDAPLNNPLSLEEFSRLQAAGRGGILDL
tara:strand:- start:1653 stop:2582 length:930 start_codon:yes stop_codon:yes gene_type:complete